MAGQLRRNPHVDEHDLRAGVHWSDDDLEGTEVADYAKIEEDEDQDIAFLLDKQGRLPETGHNKACGRAVSPFLGEERRGPIARAAAEPHDDERCSTGWKLSRNCARPKSGSGRSQAT